MSWAAAVAMTSRVESPRQAFANMSTTTYFATLSDAAGPWGAGQQCGREVLSDSLYGRYRG